MHKTLANAMCAYMLLTALFISPSMGYSAELPASQKSQNIHAMSKNSQLIIWSFLKELGLPNPFLPPRPKPKPAPKPSPTPTPPKPVAEDDDFLWEEDDFLNDERSFDEIRTDYERQYQAIKDKWDKELERRMSIWHQPTDDFLSFHDAIAQQTAEAAAYLFNEEETRLTASGEPAQGIKQMQPGDFHILPRTLDIPIRAQKGRGTCAAFAFVRAMESILAAYGEFIDLSENHFYWLAKLECRTPGACACTAEQRDEPNNNCPSDGLVSSRVIKLFHQNSPELYTVTESQCRYRTSPYPLELTGAPLSACQPFNSRVAKPGKARILKHHGEPAQAILNNNPVIISVRVTKKMYAITRNTPTEQQMASLLIGQNGDSLIPLKKGGGGHAMLAVGVIKLPQKYWDTEGQYCLLTANSWGLKFGAAGYTCFTEKWLNTYQYSGIALETLDVRQGYYPKSL